MQQITPRAPPPPWLLPASTLFPFSYPRVPPLSLFFKPSVSCSPEECFLATLSASFTPGFQPRFYISGLKTDVKNQRSKQPNLQFHLLPLRTLYQRAIDSTPRSPPCCRHPRCRRRLNSFCPSLNRFCPRYRPGCLGRGPSYPPGSGLLRGEKGGSERWLVVVEGEVCALPACREGLSSC